MPLSPRPRLNPALAPAAQRVAAVAERRAQLPVRPQRPRRGSRAALEALDVPGSPAARAAEHEHDDDHVEHLPLRAFLTLSVPTWLDDHRATKFPSMTRGETYRLAMKRLADGLLLNSATWSQDCMHARAGLAAEREEQQRRAAERHAVRSALQRGGRRADELIAQLLEMPGDGDAAEADGDLRIVKRGEQYKLDALPRPQSETRTIKVWMSEFAYAEIMHVLHYANVSPSVFALPSLWGLPWVLGSDTRSLHEREIVAESGIALRARGGIPALNMQTVRCSHCGWVSADPR